MKKVSASILSADFSRLADEVKNVEKAGADLIHFDIMDGHFVPNLTFGPMVVSSLRDKTKLPFDVHLMVENPENYFEALERGGAGYVTVQVEASLHLQRILCHIRERGMKSGAALNPATPISFLDYVMDDLDLILIMSVNPGFGAQEFIPAVLTKIKEVRQRIDKSGRNILLSVDGGLHPETSTAVIKAGADILVAGSSIFGSKDYARAIASISGESRANRNGLGSNM
ncbi:MAG: ribulose-phosphate 3-epimerase [Firmicutes bacterium]|nr:ribulose-phosphate 3-epimerase [Bacillota bacterium]